MLYNYELTEPAFPCQINLYPVSHSSHTRHPLRICKENLKQWQYRQVTDFVTIICTIHSINYGILCEYWRETVEWSYCFPGVGAIIFNFNHLSQYKLSLAARSLKHSSLPSFPKADPATHSIRYTAIPSTLESEKRTKIRKAYACNKACH